MMFCHLESFSIPHPLNISNFAGASDAAVEVWWANLRRRCWMCLWLICTWLTRSVYRKLRSVAYWFVMLLSVSVKPDKNTWKHFGHNTPIYSMKSLQPVHRSPTVCHTPVACFQCHPLTQPPSHMYGWATGGGQPSTGWLRGFCPHSYYGDYSTEY